MKQITITYHAIERFKERFGYLWRGGNIRETKQHILELIEELKKEIVIDQEVAVLIYKKEWPIQRCSNKLMQISNPLK